MTRRTTVLDKIDDVFSDGRPVSWFPGRQLFVADATECRDILWNKSGVYEEATDFYSTKWGTLCPRTSQISMGAAFKRLLINALDQIDLEKNLNDLPKTTTWPKTGNRLCYEILKPFIFANMQNTSLMRLVDVLIKHRIYRSGVHTPEFMRALLRRRLVNAFKKQLAHRKAIPSQFPDLFDAIIENYDPDAPVEQAVQVYVAAIFSLIGSVGYAVGWTLYLSVKYEALDHHCRDLVSEALRLYPIAWMTHRVPVRDHMVLGTLVTPKDRVTVCAYAMQRSPRNWDNPRNFDPTRWSGASDRKAWLPFGAGPHMCIGVDFTFKFAEGILSQLNKAWRLKIHCPDMTPNIDVALKPPNFALTLNSRT